LHPNRGHDARKRFRRRSSTGEIVKPALPNQNRASRAPTSRERSGHLQRINDKSATCHGVSFCWESTRSPYLEDYE
jgi:hypothetical protein